MPYQDKERQRQTQRDWARKRRIDWLTNQVCGDCGTPGPDLHVFGAKNVGSGAFTSRPERRAVLLADAVYLCDRCVGRHRSALAAAAAQRRNAGRRTPEYREQRRAAKPAVVDLGERRARNAHPTAQPATLALSAPAPTPATSTAECEVTVDVSPESTPVAPITIAATSTTTYEGVLADEQRRLDRRQAREERRRAWRQNR